MFLYFFQLLDVECIPWLVVLSSLQSQQYGSVISSNLSSPHSLSVSLSLISAIVVISCFDSSKDPVMTLGSLR